jgi:hypothetical protein
MNILFIIGKTAGITLVLFGFLHIIIFDKLFRDKSWYPKFKKISRIVIIYLTVLTFGCGMAILILSSLL